MATAPPISDFAPHGGASTRSGIVIPVRYVAQGQVVHATSTAIGVDDADVRSVVVPKVGIPIALKLYFPHPGGILSRNAVVAELIIYRLNEEVPRGRAAPSMEINLLGRSL